MIIVTSTLQKMTAGVKELGTFCMDVAQAFDSVAQLLKRRPVLRLSPPTGGHHIIDVTRTGVRLACRHSVPDFRHTGFLGVIIGSIIMNIHEQWPACCWGLVSVVNL